MKPTILITGRGGFCGRHFSAFIEQQGGRVVSVGATPSTNPNHYDINVLDSTAWQRVLEKEQPDRIVHLAGTTRGTLEEMRLVNVGIAETLLSACRETGWDRGAILLMGSGAEYGHFDPSELPLTEETACQPSAPYGITKREQTQLALQIAETGLALKIVRPFNIIGPGISSHLFLGAMLDQLLPIAAGRTPARIEVGNLSAQRDFVDVRDFCSACWALSENVLGAGEVFNLCSGNPVSMQELLDSLLELMGLAHVEVAQRDYVPHPQDIPIHYGAFTKLNQQVGFKPTYDYRDSLRYILENTAHV